VAFAMLLGAAPALAQQADDGLTQARSLMDSEELDEAAAVLQQILQNVPDSGEAHRLLAEILERQGRTDEARVARRAAYEAGVRQAALLRLLGRDLISEGAYGLAARVLEEADALEPLSFGPRRGLALALGHAERYEEAVEQLSILLALAPDDLALRTARARAEIVMGHERAALSDLELLLRAKPEDVEYQLLHGKMLARMGRFDEAIAVFEKVLTMKAARDQLSIAQADIGSAQGQMGDSAAAEKAYRSALSLDLGNAIAAANLADLLIDGNGEQEAERILRAALVRTPQAAILYYHLGKLQLSQGQAKDAETNLREAVKRNPGNPRYHYQLALALHRQDKTEEAEKEMAVHKRLLERYRSRSGME
jgi:Flp pilus assembly protein TadD